MVIVVVSELQQLSFEICRTPEWNLIQKFSPYSSDQSLNERVRRWHMRYGLDLGHIKDAQIVLPAMKLEMMERAPPGSRSLAIVAMRCK